MDPDNMFDKPSHKENYKCQLLYTVAWLQWIFPLIIFFIILGVDNPHNYLLLSTRIIEGFFLMWAGISLFFLGWHYEQRGEYEGFRGFIAKHRKYALLLGLPMVLEIIRVLMKI